MSMELTDDEIRTAAALLSSERLSAFLKITGTERDAIELHYQVMQVGAALMPVTGLIEIVLRNAICENLRQTFGHPDWLTNPPAPFEWKGEEQEGIKKATAWARRAAYAKMTHAEKRNLDALAYPNGVPADTSHEHRSKARQRVVLITTGQLIAQLTLFFWKRLFSADYADTLWKRSLKRLFPNKTLARAQIADHLEIVYQARNRIAHHEPVMGARLARSMASIEFLALNFGTKDASEEGILAKMAAPYRMALKREAHDLEALLKRFTI
jgi:hypothetical protein